MPAIERLADEAECTRLYADFANHIDTRRYEELLELFTEDGVLDRMGSVTRGRAELRKFLEARPVTVETRHLCTNIRLDFQSADEATGVCYVLFFQGNPGGEGSAMLSGPPSVVEYHDNFLRTAQGWRIRQRRIRMAMRPATP